MGGSDARALSRSLLDLCRMRKLTIATARVLHRRPGRGALTDIPGSSDVIDRGFVTYSNEAKRAMLGVNALTLATFGAVSKETATAMAVGGAGARRRSISRSRSPASPARAARRRQAGRARPFCGSRARRPDHASRMRFGAIGRTAVRQRSVVEALRMLTELARGPQSLDQSRAAKPQAVCVRASPARTRGSAVKRRRPPRA